MQSTVLIGALRRAPLFENLTGDELRHVAEPGPENLIRAGERNGLEEETARSAREVSR